MNAVTEAHRAGALASTVDPAALAVAHVHFDRLSGTANLEHVLFNALQGATAARFEIHGPDGAGKSSTIARLVRDLTALDGAAYEVLWLSVGDPRVLDGTLAFAQHLIATVAGQAYRFASDVQAVIESAGAEEVTVHEEQTTRHAEMAVDVRVISGRYGLDLTQRFRDLKWGAQAQSARSDLQAIITALHAAGRRPLVVIDDTEKFALTAGGVIDEEALVGLVAHAIPMLADLGVDVLVATHPRFGECAAYERSRTKWLKRAVIPPLSLQVDGGLPLGTIIDRHLTTSGVQSSWREIFEPTVLHQLQTLYFVNDRNLRTVLDCAQAAIDIGAADGAPLVKSNYLYRALSQA
jgi:hypothetical protein